MFEDSSCKLCGIVESMGDGSKSFGAMVDSVHGGDVGKEGLSGTDVRGCFFSSDVLLSGLKSHSVG